MLVMNKKRVLFVCIGNSCRSPMAEGFARKYGSDVLEVQSAGLSPASIVQSQTRKAMAEKNINIDDLFPKDFANITLSNFDLIVNLSGVRLPTRATVPVRDWTVQDPIGCSEDIYTTVRDQIETLVMQLILEARRDAKNAAPATQQPQPVGFQRAAAPPLPERGEAPKQRRFLRTR